MRQRNNCGSQGTCRVLSPWVRRRFRSPWIPSGARCHRDGPAIPSRAHWEACTDLNIWEFVVAPPNHGGNVLLPRCRGQEVRPKQGAQSRRRQGGQVGGAERVGRSGADDCDVTVNIIFKVVVFIVCLGNLTQSDRQVLVLEAVPRRSCRCRGRHCRCCRHLCCHRRFRGHRATVAVAIAIARLDVRPEAEVDGIQRQLKKLQCYFLVYFGLVRMFGPPPSTNDVLLVTIIDGGQAICLITCS